MTLYDLEADVSEMKNVLSANPEVAARLRSHAKAFEKELTQNIRPAASVENPKPLSK